MADIKDVYRKASGVDIDQQRDLWDERGRGYYGEFMVFNELYGNIPGMSKIMMNLEIPVPGKDKTTEIDLLLIHETGIYSFEMKHYKGDIYGSTGDAVWTQYFRTVENSHFTSPMEQNRYHIEALKSIFPDIPIHSFIVFTNDDCVLHIDGNVVDSKLVENTVICRFSTLAGSFISFSQSKNNALSEEQINTAFLKLKPYSKLKDIRVKTEGEPVEILEYFSKFNQAFKDKVADTKDHYAKLCEEKETEFAQRKDVLERATKDKANRFKKLTALVCACFVLSLAVAIAGVTVLPKRAVNEANRKADERIAEAELKMQETEEKYEEFFSMFEPVREITLDDFSSGDLVTVSNVSTRDSSGLSNAAVVSYKLAGTGKLYALGFTPDTKLIIRLISGKIRESSVYSDRVGGLNSMNSYLYKLCGSYYPEMTVSDIVVLDANPDDVCYMKLINLCLLRTDDANTIIRSDAELEIYNAE